MDDIDKLIEKKVLEYQGKSLFWQLGSTTVIVKKVKYLLIHQEKLVFPPVIPPEAINQCVSHIVKICNQLSKEEDKAILKSNQAQDLIVKYQDFIYKTIQHYPKQKLVHRLGIAEIQQYVSEYLLKIVPKLALQYKGEALFSTYLSKIIKNFLFKLVEKSNKNPIDSLLELPKDMFIDVAFSLDDDFIFALQKQVYENYLNDLTISNRKEFVFCSKIHFRFILTLKELLVFYPATPLELQNTYLKHFGNSSYVALRQQKVYELLAPIVNYVRLQNGRNPVKADTLRSANSRRIKQIRVNMLNKLTEHNQLLVDKTNLADFLYRYYYEE